MTDRNEIILYQPDEAVKLEVRLSEETVWLTQQQMTVLFETTKQNVSLHINNIFKERELDKNSVVKDYLTTAADGKKYRTQYYNLDVIISVGYRVKSQRGTQFRIWATSILKDYLLRGYALNSRLANIENQIETQRKILADHQQKIDFFVRTNALPVEQVFFEGQFFEARVLLEKLIKSATQRVIIIDAYVDAATFEMLDVRSAGVIADIYSGKDLAALRNIHNSTAGVEPINTHIWSTPSHDRWLIVDNNLYHCGHSLKDIGRKLSAITLMGTLPETVLGAVR
ncbi:MAG: virulence RhuM family protein [Salinivirgaceae bacterium]|nr:virulence RhuM family protein [Salinivirgaceae bacterium]